MNPAPAPTNARAFPGMMMFCLLLWLFALVSFGVAIWLLAAGDLPWSGFSMLTAGLLALTGLGLYRLRRWGVVLFGLVAAAGSINHLARTFSSYTSLPTGNLLGALGALVSILVAILIPLGLIYLTILFWRQTH